MYFQESPNCRAVSLSFHTHHRFLPFPPFLCDREHLCWLPKETKGRITETKPKVSCHLTSSLSPWSHLNTVTGSVTHKALQSVFVVKGNPHIKSPMSELQPRALSILVILKGPSVTTNNTSQQPRMMEPSCTIQSWLTGNPTSRFWDHL